MRLAKFFLFELVLVLFGTLFLGVIAHELIHIILLGNVQGICFGLCNSEGSLRLDCFLFF